MNKFYKVLILSIISVGMAIPYADAAVSENAKRAVYTQNIPEMLSAANWSVDDERYVVDAFCSGIDLSDYSYEQLKNWRNNVRSKQLSQMLSTALFQKKIEILKEIRHLTAEEFVAYTLVYPQRKPILSEYIQDVLLANLNQLSLTELMYYDDYLPQEFHGKLSEEIKKRHEEVCKLLINKETNFYAYEKQMKDRLKYLIEMQLWNCFVEGHQELNNAYAEIGIVPDDPYIAAEQYQSLVRICFPTQVIRESLQKEVDKYCAEINKAREEYHRLSGKKNYTKASYKVPVFKVDSEVSVAPLNEVSVARERFIRNREDISTGTSVLGYFFGGVVGLVAKGIGDWFAIDGLVSSEYEARKKYMDSVQKRLITTFADYADVVTRGVDKSI